MHTALANPVIEVRTIGERPNPESGRISERPIPPGTRAVLLGMYGEIVAAHHAEGEAMMNGMFGNMKPARAHAEPLRILLTFDPLVSFHSLIRRNGPPTRAICFVATANPKESRLRRLSRLQRTAVSRIKKAHTLSVQLYPMRNGKPRVKGARLRAFSRGGTNAKIVKTEAIWKRKIPSRMSWRPAMYDGIRAKKFMAG